MTTLTNKEVLAMLPAVYNDGDPVDSLLDLFLNHLDEIFEEQMGNHPLNLNQMFKRDEVKSAEGPVTNLEDFLDEFHKADPALIFWFSWAPFRYYMRENGNSCWANHVLLHNAKVERDHAEELKRWTGLKITVDG